MLKEKILVAAVGVVKFHGLRSLTRQTVAQSAACAVGTVNYHFQTMAALRDAVVAYAIEHEVIEILAQARAVRHPRVRRMTAALKERVANHITGR